MQQLADQIKRMEEILERLASQAPQITIETIHIHEPVLEKMEYRLDHLDIDTLSGSLNLGNNFGTKPNSVNPPKTSSTQQKTSPANTDSINDSEPNLQQTSFGYRLRKKD
jgi:hypothetical protein